MESEFCHLKIMQESSKESWTIFVHNTFRKTKYIQKDCFSFRTVLESATRWRYVQGNISPFHSFCPLAPSISRKLKSFFGQSYSFEIEQTQQIPSLESHIDQNVKPFSSTHNETKIIWISILILLTLKPNNCRKVFFSSSNYLPEAF